MDSVEQLLSRVDADFYKSYLATKQESKKPVFFYHIKKTGGMSINYSLLSAQLVNGKLPPLRQIQSYKYDDMADQEKLTQMSMTPSTIIMSHLDYGAHIAFREEFDLVTVLREPYKRVLSNYTYMCMRRQQQPSLNDFKKYFSATENINAMNRQLSPSKHKVDANLTFANLQKEFTYFGTTTDINLFIEHFISRFQLPNVLMPRMNETLPEYRLDGSEFREQILELNEEDMKLYQYVRARPRLPLVACEQDNVNGYTALQHEVEKEVESRCRTFVVPTNALFNHLVHWEKNSDEGKLLTVQQILSSAKS